MVCFITWASIKLRAERIRRIRIEKERDTSSKSNLELLTKIHNLEYDLNASQESVVSYDSLYDGIKKINELNEAQIKNLEERIQRQVDIIKELEQDKDNLIKCIERTGIRRTDGVVRKCNAGHIQSVISGTHAILNKPEKKGKNKEELKECAIEIDGKTQLRKYDPMKNAFPREYLIGKGIDVVCVYDSRLKGSKNYRKSGLKGRTTQSNNSTPFCDWEDGKDQICMDVQELAPLNPTDHPNYPNLNWE